MAAWGPIVVSFLGMAIKGGPVISGARPLALGRLGNDWEWIEAGVNPHYQLLFSGPTAVAGNDAFS